MQCVYSAMSWQEKVIIAVAENLFPAIKNTFLFTSIFYKNTP